MGGKKSRRHINFPYLTRVEMERYCSNRERLRFVQKCNVIISSVKIRFIKNKYGTYNNY